MEGLDTTSNVNIQNGAALEEQQSFAPNATDATDASGEENANNSENYFEAAAKDGVEPPDGIEILVQMAKTGDIDAKAVDIIDVTDKFLKAIAAAPKENLRQSGKVLFHACVLLRMKADSLLAPPVEDDFMGDDYMDFDENGLPIDFTPSEREPRQLTIQDLEKALVRKSNRKKVRKRQVTLDELIQALREAEEIEKTRAERKPKARIDLAGHLEVNDVDDILDLAHDEDIDLTITKVEVLLSKILKIGENIELFALVRQLDEKNDWVDCFLASLFLSNAGKIELEQEEFYGPLYLALCGEDTVSNTVVS